MVFVGDPFRHHSASSGYHQLVRYFRDAGWVSADALERGDLRWYRECARVDGCKRPVWHVLHADFSPLVRTIQRLVPAVRVVATLHQPAWFVRSLGGDQQAAVETADAIVLVSQRQARDLGGLAARRAIVIPHGVANDAFSASERRGTDPRSWLVVGEHLRDWSFIREVCRQGSRCGIRWTIIVPKRLAAALGTVAGARIETEIPEQRLALLYHEAGGLLLSLVDATANNTLLEAMAAGCMVAANRLPGIEEYGAGDVAYYPSGDVQGCLAAIERIISMSPVERARRAAALTSRAAALDWAHVAARYDALFQALEADHA